jgi:hypothetical protein
MDSEARPSRMVDTGCVHKQHLGKSLELLDGHRENMALPPREETGRIGGRDAFGGDRLGEDVIGTTRPRVRSRASQMVVGTSTSLVRWRIGAPRDRCGPRSISRAAGTGLTPGERNEASPDNGSIRRRPRSCRERRLSLTRHRVLQIDELPVTRRPRSDTASHDAMMASACGLAFGEVFCSTPMGQRM